MSLVAALPDDPDFVRRLRLQDPSALTTLYDTYGRIVYRVILHIVRDPSASEDIVQDTFARVWSNAPLIDHDALHVGPWILTIARNRALDFLRASHSRNSVQDAFARLEVHLTQGSAEDSIISEENARRLGKALSTLNFNQRTVIELAYYHGLSQSQIAEELHQPLGTVKSWIRGALMNLRTVMQSQSGEEKHA